MDRPSKPAPKPRAPAKARAAADPLVTTLSTLIDTPSVTGGEGRICTYVAQRLLPLYGASVQRIRNSLVVGERTGRPMLAMFGHLDTVPSQGQGPARLDGGRLFGLGASDMKAGLAVMIHLLEHPEVREGPYDCIGVFYEAEEGPSADNGLEEVLNRAQWLRRITLGLVLEPTDLAIELGCQGMVNARVRFLGTSSHSARPWLGRNAISKAGEWLAELDRMQAQSVMVGGLEYKESFSVTMATGGVAANVIPASFELNLNHRFPPDRNLEQAIARVREVAGAADEVEIVDSAPAGPLAEANPTVVRLAEVTGARYAPKLGWTDVARLAGRGISAINYGPGDPNLAHTVGESVEVWKLETAYDGLFQLLTRS